MQENLSQVRFSHSIPNMWVGSHLHSNILSDEFNSLVEYFSTNNILVNDILLLRKKDFYKTLYYEFHREIEEGTGVVLIQDSALKNFDSVTKKKIFLNVCYFFGNPVYINKSRDIIKEVKNTGQKDSVYNPVRGHMTNQELAFHSDRADITSLLCESPAESGGEFKICSSSQLFYALSNFPDIVQILSEDIPHDLRGDGNGIQDFCSHPIISNGDVFVVRYIRKFIESIVRHGQYLDKRLVKALDHLDSILNNPDIYSQFEFCSGDIIFFNNHTTLHARNKFEDSDKNQRCLFRVWLSSEFTRKLPDSFKPIFHSVLPGTVRGGIV